LSKNSLLQSSYCSCRAHSRGNKSRKQGTEAERSARLGRNGPHERVTPQSGGTRSARDDRRRQGLEPGTRRFRSGRERAGVSVEEIPAT